MPFQSDKQRRFMYAEHPDIARRWTAEEKMAGNQKLRQAAIRSKEKGKVKDTGSYKGQSNALGHGGRAAQLRDKGVPNGVIGMLARKKGAAPGGPNYHGGK